MQSMRKIDGVLTIAAALLVVVGTSGCQSGWKFSNPFSRAPKASSADAPKELDDDFADIDEITPPPENYTVGDSALKHEKKSIAQTGKYGDEEENRSVVASGETAPSTENFTTPSYAQSYQSPSPANSFAAGVGSSTPSDARQPVAAQTLADTVSGISPDASIAAATQPYAPMNAVAPQSVNPGYPTNVADQGTIAAQNQAVVAQNQATSTADPFPSASANYSSPIAQVGATTQNQTFAQQPQVPTQPQRQPAAVAFNYDANAPAAYPVPNANVNATPGFSPASTPGDPDPYSGVNYTPQTTSSGFAPGSVLY